MGTTTYLDALGRRCRFSRTPLGKRLVLGPRDTVILRWLYRYRYLRQDHLLALIQPKSEKRFVERLGDLFHETGYINRPALLAPQFDARSTPMLYEISPSGLAYLEALDAVPSRAVTFSRRTRCAYNPQTLHTIMIIDALVGIECATRQLADQRFVSVDEILARAPAATRHAPNPLSVPVTLYPDRNHPVIRSRMDTHLIPDALYGIEIRTGSGNRHQFFALECERTSPVSRSTATASSRALKQAAYDALIRSGTFKQHWGIPNLAPQFCSVSKGLVTK